MISEWFIVKMGTSVAMVYELTHVCSEYGQMRYTWVYNNIER